MKSKLLIIGASGHGKVIADMALKLNWWKHVAFLDDNENIKYSMGIEVIGKSSDVSGYLKDWDIIVGIGSNDVRSRIQIQLETAGANLPILVHPNAIIGEQVEIGAGTVVMAGVVINCCTKIGKGCIINTGATIDHDNVIRDFVHVSPGTRLAGDVIIGESNWLGIGSIISNNVRIADGSKVGAGAVVVRDITEAGTYVGIPARRIYK